MSKKIQPIPVALHATIYIEENLTLKQGDNYEKRTWAIIMPSETDSIEPKQFDESMDVLEDILKKKAMRFIDDNCLKKIPQDTKPTQPSSEVGSPNDIWKQSNYDANTQYAYSDKAPATKDKLFQNKAFNEASAVPMADGMIYWLSGDNFKTVNRKKQK